MGGTGGVVSLAGGTLLSIRLLVLRRPVCAVADVLAAGV